MKTKLRISATAIVEDEHGRFLMVCEGRGKKAGKWNFPTGRVREEEDVLTAAQRELREETGLMTRMDAVVGVYRYKSPAGHHAVRVVYRGRFHGGRVRLPQGEILDAIWMSEDELHRITDEAIWIPTVIRTIAADLCRREDLPTGVIQSLYGQSGAGFDASFSSR